MFGGEYFGAGGGKKKGPSEAKNSLVSKQEARFIDIISEGPIRGLADGAKSIMLSGVPHQNKNGTYNHTGFTWEERKGEEDQQPSTLMSAIESEHPVNVEVSQKSGPVVQAVLEDNLDGFRTRIRIPQLMRVTDDGSIVPSKVTFSIEWSEGDTGIWRHITGSPMVVAGKNNSPYYVDYEFFPPKAGPWQIRVTRMSPDDETAKESSAIFFDAWVGIISQKFIMPFSAYLAFNVDAEQFGSSIPERSYDVFGRIVRVPSNFDGEARTYNGFWDGSWKLAWTDDPAWCFLDLISNKRYGAGFDEWEIDTASLYTISKYCSELVPDGNGGQEFRYSLNVSINTREDAYSLLKKMITTFRGMMYWAGGQLTLAQDSPKPVKFIATPANTENGAFIYRSTSDESRANTIQVTYNNPSDGDKPDIEVAEKVDDIVKKGMKIAEVQAWGCRSQGQARRLGEWMLYTLHHDTEIVSYVAGPDHDMIYPGDIIAVLDPAKTATKKSSGRMVQQLSPTSFRLDRELRDDIAIGFTFCIADNDKILRYSKITAIDISRTIITVDVAQPMIDVDHLWTVYESDTRLREYSVTSIKPKGSRKAVTALAYNLSKFPFVERGIALEKPPTDPLTDAGELRGPRYFDYSVYRVEHQGTSNIIRLLVSWTAPQDEQRVAFYRLQFAYAEMGDPAWETVYEGRDTSYTFNDLDPAIPVAVRIQSVGIDGNQISAWQTITNIELTSRVQPPATVDSLVAVPEESGLSIVVTWNYANPPADFKTAQVWRATENDISRATLIGESATGQFRDFNLATGIVYYYWIRAEVITDNPAARYSEFRGPTAAAALPTPITDVLDGSITSEKIADAAIIANKIANGAVGNNAIASNSIYGDVIAAGAITAREMVITDYTNVIPDAAMEGGNWSFSAPLQQKIVNTGDFSLGSKAIEFNNPTSGDWWQVTEGTAFIPVEAGQAYRLQFESKSAVSRYLWFRFSFYDLNQQRLPGGDAQSPAVNTGQIAGSPDVVKHIGTATVPANACFAKVQVYCRFAASGAGSVRIGGFYSQRKNAAELIVDGSLTAGMIAANSINAGHIMSNAVTADKINVVNLSAINADLGNITAGSLNINNLFKVSRQGQVTILSSTSGERLEINNSLVKVYDANGVERVRLGIW